MNGLVLRLLATGLCTAALVGVALWTRRRTTREPKRAVRDGLGGASTLRPVGCPIAGKAIVVPTDEPLPMRMVPDGGARSYAASCRADSVVGRPSPESEA